MTRNAIAGMVPLLVSLGLVSLVSCRSLQRSNKEEVRSWPDLAATHLDYVDSDAFDALFETTLVNQDPAVIVRTGRARPDWEPRLNAWIAAWNRGEASSRRPKLRGAADEPAPTVRGQSPLPLPGLNGDSLREVRLLVGGLLDRAEDLAQSGSSWWAEERERSRRVTLLRPYSLRFHVDADGKLQLVFFHGGYASYYPRFLQLLTESTTMSEEGWSRGVECSCAPAGRREPVEGKLTGRAHPE